MTILILISTAVLGAQYDVDLEYQDGSAAKLADGSNPLVFNYTVTHTGTAVSEDVYIDLTGVSVLWQISFTANPDSGLAIGTYSPTTPFDFLLSRNETCDLTITVQPFMNQLNMTYWMKVDAYPRLNASNNDTHIFGVIIGHVPDCHIGLANPPASGEFLLDTPSITTFRYYLYNTGNGIDRYFVRPFSSHGDQGWGLTLNSGMDAWGFTPNLTADPLKKTPHIIDVELAVPFGARGNETGWLTINVTSVFDPSSSSSEVNATFRTNQTYAFSVSVDRPERSVYPMDLQIFNVTVENEGNGWDYFTIRVDGFVVEGISYQLGYGPWGINLDAGESGIIAFDLLVHPGSSSVVFNLTVSVFSSDPSTPPSQDLVIVTIEQLYGLRMDMDDVRLQAEPGDDIGFELRIFNEGNGPDTVVLDIHGIPKSWLWYIDPPSIEIEKEDWESVDVVVIIPSRFEEAPIGSYHFNIKATSENMNVSAPFEFVIEVLQVHRLEWMFMDEPLTNPERPLVPNDTLRPMRSFNPYQSESIVVTLGLRNFGNGDDNATISSVNPTTGIHVAVIPEMTLFLSSQEKFIKITITVSEDTPPGIYRIFVRAASEDSGMAVRVVPIEFEVNNLDASLPAVPTYVDPEDGPVTIPKIVIALGTEMEFEIVVTNTGSRALPTVFIKGFDNYIKDGEPTRVNFYNLSTPPIDVGETYRIWSGPNGDSTDRIAWLSHTSGDHVLEFMLFFDHQSDVTNDRCSVNISVNDPPELTINTTSLEMKVGENLTVEGTVSDDMSTILWVSYRIDDGEWIRANGTSEWSFTIEDADLSKGEHTLEVKASDGVSESTVANLTFTVKGRSDDTSTPGPSLPFTVLCIITVGILGTLTRKGRKR